MYEVDLNVYGISCLVPGQHDDLILGTNLIKHLTHQMKGTDEYWRLISECTLQPSPAGEYFLNMMTNLTCWQSEEMPRKIGTVKLNQAVTLLAKQEHLVWGRLPNSVPMSPGSTIVVEPTSFKTMPQNIIVGRVITPMWGDRWVPMKVTNLSDKPITLKRNCKLADVSPCLAVEDFTIFQGSCKMEGGTLGKQPITIDSVKLKQRLLDVGLGEIDIEPCKISQASREELVQLLINYNDVFSKSALVVAKPRALSIAFDSQMTDRFAYHIGGFRLPITRNYDKC